MQNRSLTATGRPASGVSGPGIGSGARVGDPGVRVQLVGRGARAIGLEQLARAEFTRADLCDRLGRGQFDQRGSFAARPGAGNAEAAVDGLRRRRQDRVAVKARHRLVGAHHAGQIDRVRGRLDVRRGRAHGSGRRDRARPTARRPSSAARHRRAAAGPAWRRGAPVRVRALRIDSRSRGRQTRATARPRSVGPARAANPARAAATRTLPRGSPASPPAPGRRPGTGLPRWSRA